MKKNIIGRFGISLTYLLSVHLLALLMFTLFRWVQFCTVEYTFPEDIAGECP